MRKNIETTPKFSSDDWDFIKEYESLSNDAQRVIKIIVEIGTLLPDDDFHFFMQFLVNQTRELQQLKNNLE